MHGEDCSMKTECFLSGVLVFLLGSFAAVPARADCTISVDSLRFGSYDVFSDVPLDSTGTVVYRCGNKDKQISITLSTGSSGTYDARTLRNGGEALLYNLFIDGLTSVWGDGSAGTGFYYRKNPPNDRPVSLTVFGRIPPRQDVSQGVYADTVQVIINF
jgi:spore coat protein U-like protein